MITDDCRGIDFPVRKKKGTPFHRSLSIKNRAATKVSVFESGATCASCR